MKRPSFWLLAVLWLAIGSTAQAGIFITIGDLSLGAGGQGHLDVSIRSDSGDSLAGFLVSYQISAAGLEFASGPGEPDDLQLGDPNYVFPLLNSAAAANPPAGTISTTTFTNDTYTGSDATLDNSGVTIPSTNVLLTRLHLTATTAHPGDQFAISLDPQNTSFVDANFGSIAFSSNSGTVQITGTPVPEPATIAISALLAVCFGGLHLGRWRLRR